MQSIRKSNVVNFCAYKYRRLSEENLKKLKNAIVSGNDDVLALLFNETEHYCDTELKDLVELCLLKSPPDKIYHIMEILSERAVIHFEDSNKINIFDILKMRFGDSIGVEFFSKILETEFMWKHYEFGYSS